ncbi:DUF2597 family protein [Enterovibrio sp. ZSDZ42]|uniref:DUF2597 family protein n=1 Tax=Enterovibrio gelatinilyticus TaxID=2899819 RepID=A0ABT5QYY8_9GAMM|nr:phage protein [Enterovibrio sp. ZSDZ42]MDD1792522.1 DUF2597 family protein [Enterovibrio sp. ZSDZ42]
MSQRISGKNLKFLLGGLKINAQKWTLSITDGDAVTYTNGIPDGYVDGEVSAAGDLEVNTANFNLILAAAKVKGSFRGLGTFDAKGFGAVGRDVLNIDMFGVKLKISDLIDADSAGGSALIHKITFDITSPDFININGVPYLRPDEAVDILG